MRLRHPIPRHPHGWYLMINSSNVCVCVVVRSWGELDKTMRSQKSLSTYVRNPALVALAVAVGVVAEM